ncbi:MAG: hypothetical protein IPN59_15300 [Holophaga sp.]|nr:hypothetical protein [Holophaga sp.]
MTPLPWLTLDALQAGGLLALAAAFATDGLHRRDRMMLWLGLSCLLISLRHATGILDAAAIVSIGTADRLQSGLASLGYLAMMRALVIVFPAFYPRRLVLGMTLGLLPNFLRCIFLPLSGDLALALHLLTGAVYFTGFGLTLVAMVKAHRAKDPFGKRLLAGLLITMAPAGVEVVLRLGFGFQLRISGIGMILMAISLAASWFWVLTYDLQFRIKHLQAEVEAWRSLVPGATWHTKEDSPLMQGLFGAQWAKRLEERMLGTDGIHYRVHRTQASTGAELGWLEARRESDPNSFLRGWTMALGLEDGEDFQRIQGWLQRWGAQVESWGMMPPREGPYPSILLWLREPSILAVWREADLARRRCRWVQVGGPRLEGPHVRLEAPLQEEALRKALQSLVVLHH